jgi:pyrimidine-nucleoside phosphorylase
VPFWIAAKRDGQALEDDVLRTLVHGAATGAIPDYQTSALLMAIVFRGLDERELGTWLEAMVDSGERLRWDDLPGLKVDKHSTGGVGDKISLCLAPLVAACGVYVPMMSGRSLGHTGGTLDKLESIPGLRTDLDRALFHRVLSQSGMAMAGQSASIVPADRKLYALRDATATVESIPLIASSILSKKVAEGADALVMDVKVGAGAFLPDQNAARLLGQTLVALGSRAGLKVHVHLTDMEQPTGRSVGNALEVEEALEVLRGSGPADTVELTLALGASMLRAAGVTDDEGKARRRLENARRDGTGLERLMKCVALQGGDPRALEDPRRLPRARQIHVLTSPHDGYVTQLDARLVGRAATRLGAGRLRQEDKIKPGVGFRLHVKRGERAVAGQPLVTVAYDDAQGLASALPLLEAAFTFGDKAPPARPLLHDAFGALDEVPAGAARTPQRARPRLKPPMAAG